MAEKDTVQGLVCCVPRKDIADAGVGAVMIECSVHQRGTTVANAQPTTQTKEKKNKKEEDFRLVYFRHPSLHTKSCVSRRCLEDLLTSACVRACVRVRSGG